MLPKIRILYAPTKSRAGDLRLILNYFAENAAHLFVERASSFRQALSLLDANPFDLVLIDLEPQDRASLHFIKHVRSNSPQVPLIVISANTDDKTAAALLALGCYDCVWKQDNYLLKLVSSIEGAIARRSLEQKTRELEWERAKLDYLLTATPAVIYRAKASGDYGATFISANVTAQLGYSPEEFTHDSSFWADHIHPDDAPAVMAEMERLLRTGHQVLEYRFSHRSGEYRWMRDELKVTRDSHGNPVEIVGYWIDITQRKKAEEAYREADRRFSETMENIGLLCVQLDRLGRITYANPYLARLTGYSLEELIGLDWFRTFIPADRRDIQERYLRNIPEGKIRRHYENPILTRTGEERLIRWSNTVLRKLTGEVIGTTSIGEDITDLKLAEWRLREREQMLRLFIEHAPAAIAMLDRDMRYIAYSRKWLEDYGLGDKDIIGCSHYDIFPRVPRRWKEIHQRCLNGATERADEDRFLRADGTEHLYRWEIHPWNREDGSVGGIIIFTEDITQRKREKAERERLMNILESSLNEIYMFNPDTLRFEYVNTGAIRNLGFSLKQLKTMTPIDLKPEFTEEVFREKILGPLLRRETQSQMFETVHRRIDGSLYPVEVHLQLVERAGERVFLAIMVDITDRKQTEMALGEAENRLRLAVKASKVGFWDWDLRTDQVYFSPEWKHQIGYEDHEIQNDFNEWQRRLHPDDMERCLQTVQSYIANPWPDYHLEFRFRHKDGSYRWILAQASLLTDENGKPIRMLGSHVDITDRKRIELELRESGMFNQQIIASAQEGIIVLDRNLKYRVWNPYMEKITGLSAQEAVGNDPLKFFPYLDEQGIYDLLKRSLEGQTVDTPDVWIPGSEEPRWIAGTHSPLWDASGEITGVIVTLRDVTERKNMEQKLWHAQKMELTGLLAAGIAHQLNTPLAVMTMRLQMLLEDLDALGQPHLLDQVRVTQENAKKMSRIIQGLLDFSRVSKLDRETFRINDILERLVNFVDVRIRQQKIVLSCDFAADVPSISADRNKLEQAFLNILMNALDAMPQGGRLSVSSAKITRTEKDWIRIEISDTGCGMSPEVLAKLSTPFFTTKPAGKGTGLGLSVSYEIIRSHGGEIRAESKEEYGSTFQVLLPS